MTSAHCAVIAIALASLAVHPTRAFQAQTSITPVERGLWSAETGVGGGDVGRGVRAGRGPGPLKAGLGVVLDEGHGGGECLSGLTPEAHGRQSAGATGERPDPA